MAIQGTASRHPKAPNHVEEKMDIKLTPTQLKILSHAHTHSSGEIRWFPPSLTGGARTRAIQALKSRGLVEARGVGLVIAEPGYRALGVSATAQAASLPPLTGSHSMSKQAVLISLMRRRDGATIAQLCEATGWQAHTVRGALSGTLKKRLGLKISSDKVKGADRVYRLT